MYMLIASLFALSPDFSFCVSDFEGLENFIPCDGSGAGISKEVFQFPFFLCCPVTLTLPALEATKTRIVIRASFYLPLPPPFCPWRKITLPWRTLHSTNRYWLLTGFQTPCFDPGYIRLVQSVRWPLPVWRCKELWSEALPGKSMQNFPVMKPKVKAMWKKNRWP